MRNKFQWNCNRNSNIFSQENAFEHVVCEMSAILSRPQCVKITQHLRSQYWINFCYKTFHWFLGSNSMATFHLFSNWIEISSIRCSNSTGKNKTITTEFCTSHNNYTSWPAGKNVTSLVLNWEWKIVIKINSSPSSVLLKNLFTKYTARREINWDDPKHFHQGPLLLIWIKFNPSPVK